MQTSINLRFSSIAIFCFLLLASVAIPSPIQAQTPNSSGQEAKGQNVPTLPNSQDNTGNSQKTAAESENIRPSILLSLQGGEKLMAEADQAINSQQYDTAVDRLQKARQIFNQLSNFYLELATSFSGIDNSIAEDQKGKALETGQQRDRATYQLALVHRAQNKSELSVPLLIQVIKSQNPTSDLGKKSYQQLLEMGFVSVPFPASNPEKPSSGNPNSSGNAN
jgi:hypothetical protein